MSIQREVELITNPFRIHMADYGWYTEKTVGNQFQEGFPDTYAMHHKYSPRWIEMKVLDKYNHITLTPAQKIKFPLWISCGVPIYVIAAKDLRGTLNYNLRERLYQKLFEEPNGLFALSPRLHHLLL